ncbi:MAG: hypothetical protein ABSG03_38145 [Bryobacteraceae bacterium]|jgi:hypothetical protein
MPAERPYLSVVATARNDDHGANLLRRIQIFVNALAEQARRYQLPVELVLVDWNPPPEKPPLAEALRWPDAGPCRFRVLTVGPELHRRYRHYEALPLYQMIAKNAGIRRAEGEFILATNIDILLSSELMEFIAARRLERGRMYRVDRHDVDSQVPADASLEEQLAYCRAHRIRLNAREGTFALTPDGARRLGAVDVVTPAQGIFFGRGWYPPEQHFGQVFRWAGEDAEIGILKSPQARILQLETEGGPATGFGPFPLRLLDAQANIIDETEVERRATLRVRVAPGADTVRLGIQSGGQALHNGRVLSFRVFRCEWLADSAPESAPLTAGPAPFRPVSRFREVAVGGARFLWNLPRRKGSIRFGLPFSARSTDGVRIHSDSGNGPSVALVGESASVALPATPPANLHTNACGDFTLAHRTHWVELRGYPEFDLFSMNIDSVFCYMAHYGGATECVLRDPMRIYHIEHASGSGWSPEGEALLYQRLAAKGIPWIDSQKVFDWAADMERLQTTMIFNGENWGLAGFDLPEVDPSATEPRPCA